MIPNPTDEQLAIFDYVHSGKGDLEITALAGSGKTSTLLAALQVIPQRSILLSAFNKRIAEALLAKMPKLPSTHVAHVKTFHALGLTSIKRYFPQVTVDSKASEDLINDVDSKAAFKLRRAAVKLLRASKEEIVVREPMADQMIEIGHKFSLFDTKDGVLEDNEIEIVVDLVYEAYSKSLDMKARSTIDFCDMVWAPLALDLMPPSRYQAVIVDEMQDVSYPQLMMLKKMIAPNGRLIGCGDLNQAIYAWRNAVPEEVSREFTARNAKRLPLTTCFRCPTSVIAQAQKLVPTIRAKSGADEGIVEEIGLSEAINGLKHTRMMLSKHLGDLPEYHSFVLSRSNAMLLSFALLAWSKGVKFQLNAGREFLEPLFTVLDNLKTTSTKEVFVTSLMNWYASELGRASDANMVAWIDRIEEQYAMLSAAAEYAPPSRIHVLIRDMIEANGSGVLLSTVHRVKGLEAPRVFLLKRSFGRHQTGRDFDKCPLDPEELNIEYVGITRACRSLYWVDY